MKNLRWLHALGPVIALIALVIIGGLLNPAFLAPANIVNVLARSAFTGIIAVGMTFVITSGGLDLSVGSMAAFLAGMAILAMNALVPTMGANWGVVLIGMGVALLGGVLAGMVNGLLVTRARIEPFIVTLGTMGIFRSLVTWIADGGTVSLDSQLRTLYRPVYYSGLGLVTWPIITFALVAVGGHLLMRHTRFGRYVEAIGSNDRVARYSSVDVGRIQLMTYVLLGLLVGLATVIYVPRLGSASGSTGIGWELEAIAAVIIGGTALKGGHGVVWGTVVGVLILSLIDNILNLADLVSPYLNGAIQGVIIVLAVVLQRDKRAADTR